MMAKSYSVKFKLPGGWRWHQVNQLVGDDFTPNGARVVIQSDGTRLEIPHGSLVLFGPDRAESVQAKQQAGG